MWSILFILKHMCRNFRAVQVKTLYQKKKKINFFKENCLKNLFSKMESLKKKIQIFKDCFLGGNNEYWF